MSLSISISISESIFCLYLYIYICTYAHIYIYICITRTRLHSLIASPQTQLEASKQRRLELHLARRSGDEPNAASSSALDCVAVKEH